MPHAKPDDYRKLIDALKQLSPDEFRSVAIACNHGGNGGVRGKLINMLRQDQMMKERPAKTVENFVKSELKRIRGVEKRVPRALQYDEELSEEWMLLYQRVKALQEEEENERKAAAGQALIRNVDNHRARDGELHPKSNKPKPTPMPISCGLQATNPPRMPEPVENYCYGPDANGWKQNSKRVDSTTDQQHKKAAKGGTAAVLHEYSTKFQEPGPTDSTKFSQTHDVGKEGSLKGFSLVTVEGMALEADGTTSYDQVSDAFKEYRMAGGMSDDQLPKMEAKKSSKQVEMADSGSGGAVAIMGSPPDHDPSPEPETLTGSSPPQPNALFCKGTCGFEALHPPFMPDESGSNYFHDPDANGEEENSKRVDFPQKINSSTTEKQHKKAAKDGAAAVLHEYSTKLEDPALNDSSKFSQTHDVGKEGSLKGFSLVTVEGMALEADGTTSYDQGSDAFKEDRMCGGMSDDQLPKMETKKSSKQVEMADSGSGGACDFTKATVTGEGGSLPDHDPHAEAPQTLSGSSPPKPSAIFCKASCGFEALHPPFMPDESGSNYFHDPDATGEEENPEKMKWKERGDKKEPLRVHPSSGTNKDHVESTAPAMQQNLASRETVGWKGENCEDGVRKDLMKELGIYKIENLRLKDELSTCQLENAQLRMENEHAKEIEKTNKELIARLCEMEQVIKAQKAMIDAIQAIPGGTTDDARADA